MIDDFYKAIFNQNDNYNYLIANQHQLLEDSKKMWFKYNFILPNVILLTEGFPISDKASVGFIQEHMAFRALKSKNDNSIHLSIN